MPNYTHAINQTVNKQTKEKKIKYIHLERAAADLVSNPTIKVSIGTKIPPPPTPPTVPNAEPRNPIIVATTILHPNSNFCKNFKKKKNKNH